MHIIYIDADACPVKDEVYKVAKRFAVQVVVVANSTMWVPPSPLVSMVVQTGFGAADDWIAGQIGPGDLCITADIPLAARCVAAGGAAIDPKGRLLTADTVGDALALRDLLTDLRQSGSSGGGPSPMTPKDRSRFLAVLDTSLHAIRRAFPTASM